MLRVVVGAVHGLRLIKQFHEGQLVERLRAGEGPAGHIGVSVVWEAKCTMRSPLFWGFISAADWRGLYEIVFATAHPTKTGVPI
ncbi:hypothetical protein HMPREF9080_00411 [Cardiobacterium valvarum F0432]|uniref:Uncharacterized protein n=1 Tax=Cardiobacterium valvarum F0432 TaxID=797473 RepID=G9ZCD4_9GAMM|nr:hypothetical protein HMPREF9080_00411 [Cardiobacterium valvarum F0432]